MKDIAVNRKAYHDYAIEETCEAGMALMGSEIKSIRAGKVSLKESYVSFVGGEAFVKDMHIAVYKEATYNNHDEYRERKLLLHKREIKKLSNKCASNSLIGWEVSTSKSQEDPSVYTDGLFFYF